MTTIITGIIILLLYIRITFKTSDWSRAFSQYTVACELDMITQYLQQISCRVQSPPSFRAPHPCSAVKLLQIYPCKCTFSGFCNMNFFYGAGSLALRPQSPTWRARGSLFVWSLPFFGFFLFYGLMRLLAQRDMMMKCTF